MAKTSSFPEQQPVPLASGLRKGVDNRIHWTLEEKNLGGEGLKGVRKGVRGCLQPKPGKTICIPLSSPLHP